MSSHPNNKNKRTSTPIEWIQTTLLIVFYVIHLCYFYGVILWENGGQIYSKCVGIWMCRYQISRPSPSWLSEYFGISYHPDLSDHQWREFRQSLPLLIMVAIGTCCLSWICRMVIRMMSTTRIEIDTQKEKEDISEEQSIATNHPTQNKIAYWNSLIRLIVGVIAIMIQHGLHSLIILSLCLIGYGLSHLLLQRSSSSSTSSTMKSLSPRQRTIRLWMSKAIAWIYAIFILLFKESYRIKHWPSFHFLHIFFDKQYSGMYGWQLPANFLVLRWISYSFDYFEAYDKHSQYAEEKKNADSTNINVVVNSQPATTSETKETKRDDIDNALQSQSLSLAKVKIEQQDDSDDSSLHKSHSLYHYDFIYFMAYMTYAPLYMAGPIVSYNSFISSSQQPQQKVNIYFYGIRWLAWFCLLEWMTSRFPFFAVISTGLLPHLSIPQIATVFYLILKMMWLKFLTIWRFFRLWSLSDGIYTIENQQRCMSNNYSLTQFWKGWHASFNKWLVRYLYKPLGGKHYQYLNVWIIFLFVALWHDMEWKLIVWGLLNGSFYVIEVLIIQPIRERLLKGMNDVSTVNKILRHILVTVMGAFFIMVLISVNLIGYSVGTGAIDLIVEKAMAKEGVYTFCVSLYFLSVGVSLMLFLQSLGLAKK